MLTLLFRLSNCNTSSRELSTLQSPVQLRYPSPAPTTLTTTDRSMVFYREHRATEEPGLSDQNLNPG